MNIVRMKEFGQCGAACLATVLGITLDAALDLCGDERVGTTSKRLLEVLRRYYPHTEEICTEAPDPFPPSVLTVPSLNHTGLLHFVVWDGETILDPACGPKRWPDDAPVVNGEQLPVQWACAIILRDRAWPGV